MCPDCDEGSLENAIGDVQEFYCNECNWRLKNLVQGFYKCTKCSYKSCFKCQLKLKDVEPFKSDNILLPYHEHHVHGHSDEIFTCHSLSLKDNTHMAKGWASCQLSKKLNGNIKKGQIEGINCR